jgi:hypothetical protein
MKGGEKKNKRLKKKQAWPSLPPTYEEATSIN